jgi:hypothetical protein
MTLEDAVTDAQAILRQANDVIESFGITHSTVQLETTRCALTHDPSAHTHLH